MNLDGLNQEQKRAVKCTEGPLLIIAGAGSGKTRVLTHRIAYLIEECNVSPYNILAITFTNKAAKEMKERADKLIGNNAGHVWVSTFHSTCVRILRRYIDRIGYSNTFTIYDTDDQKSVIKEVCKKLNVDTKMLKEKTILHAISTAKDELISPDEMEIQAGGDYNRKRIASIYREYQKALKTNNALDFDDLIYKTVELFEKDAEVLNYYQEKFQYIMVDEYQDTNTSQFMLIAKLADKYKNLCVVGDDDQSIYKFRGANITNILSFEHTFQGAKVIKLEQNYRSTQTILNAANAVIKNNTSRKDKSLWTENGDGEPVHFSLYESGYDEAEGIVADIGRVVRDGWNYNDIAILYRTNAQSRVLEEKLMMRNIPYRIYGGVNFYQRKEIKDILAYLKTVDNGLDGQAVKRIINVPKRGIGATTIDRIQMYADSMDCSFWDALCSVDNIDSIKRGAGKVEPFIELIQEFRSKQKELSIRELVELILEDTHYIESLAETEESEEVAARQENLGELINKVVSYEDACSENGEEASLSGFLEEVALIADIDSLSQSDNQVVLMTLHSAKGLEFPIVYMTGMEDGLFPGYMSIMADDMTELEEERRLCYVGITRAKRILHLSAAKLRMVRGESQLNKVSRFIEEIPDEYIHIERNGNAYNRDKISYGGKEEAAYSIRANAKAVLDRYSSGNSGSYKGKTRVKIDGKNAYANGSYGGSAILKDTTRKPAYATKTNYGTKKSVSTETTKTVRDIESRKENKKVGFGKEFPMELFDKKKTAEKEQISREDSDSGVIAATEAHTGISGEGQLGYVVGDTVESIKFGIGRVLSIDHAVKDDMVAVDFEKFGVKKMLAGFAKLKKVEKNTKPSDKSEMM